jgi:hypothetical protein
VAVTLLAVFGPRWDPHVLLSTPFIVRSAEHGSSVRQDAIRYYRDGAVATIAVTEVDQGPRRGRRTMYVNGKPDASTYPVDQCIFSLIGHLGPLLRPDSHTAALVGLGSGRTLASLLEHPVSRVVLYELSPEVVEASHLFEDQNRGALQDERVELVVEDARVALRGGGGPFDLVVCGPSNLWVSGMAQLFTREFYEIVRDRLREDGVLVQWVDVTGRGPGLAFALLRTLTEVFPYVTVWEPWRDDVLLAASMHPPRFEPGPFEAAVDRARVDLGEFGMGTPAGVLRQLLVGPEGARELAAAGRLHEDDRPFLEHEAVQSLYRRERGFYAALMEHPVEDDPWWRSLGWSRDPDVLQAREARRLWEEGWSRVERGEEAGALERVRRAALTDPDWPQPAVELAELLAESGVGALGRGRPDEAAALLSESLHWDPDPVGPRYNLGLALVRLGRDRAAVAAFREVVAGGLDDAGIHYQLAAALHRLGETEAAVPHYERALELRPGHRPAWEGLAAARRGRPAPGL